MSDNLQISEIIDIWKRALPCTFGPNDEWLKGYNAAFEKVIAYLQRSITSTPQREVEEDEVLARLDAAFKDGYAKGYAFGQKREVEVDEAMVERALNAPLGLTTKVAHMLMHPDQHDPEKGPKWKHALMRSALTAALTRPQGDNDA